MVIDYKGVSFSFESLKRKKRWKRIRLAVISLLIVCLYFVLNSIVDVGKIAKVQSLLLANKDAEAADLFDKIEDSFFHSDAKKELKALLLLNAGEPDRAQDILNSLSSQSSAVDFKRFLGYFSDRSIYNSLKRYTDFLLRVKGNDGILFYKVLYSTALLDSKGSRDIIKTIPMEEKEKHQKEFAIIDKLNTELESGRLNYIFDVNGKPAGYYDLSAGETVSLAPGIAFDAFNNDFKKNTTFYSLTIDISLQQKLAELFEKGDYHGTFLLLDLSDTSITAAYSKSPKKEKENAVFWETYEPGSIIKVLTLFSYLRSESRELFPFKCSGVMGINGEPFYDWLKHNQVKDYEEALAVSCNLSFAQMGMELGAKKMVDTLESFYFNYGDRSGSFGDLFLRFKTGTFNKAVVNDFQLANLAVGLGKITITTFHSAFISAAIAQSGSVYSPYLIKNKKNLFNLGYYNHSSKLLTVLTDNAVFLKVKDAMVRVVEDPEGTGKRSKVDFVRVGLKTGTAGSKTRGLDAILTGFFPAEKPQYAFAFRLEGAGKAELKGAYFLKEFLTLFYRK
jgi:hypothetical protein